MNTVRIIILGTVVGIILSVLSLGSAYIAAIILTGTATLPAVIAVSTLLNGAVLGTISIGLGYLTAGSERMVLVLLISLAMAALTVMLGHYGNGSLLPVGIYSMALINGVLISKGTGVLIQRSKLTDERYVSG